jgi:hypothetical protein
VTDSAKNESLALEIPAFAVTKPTPKDTTVPTITLIGKEANFLNLGTAYVEEGATAIDDVDGDITSNIVTSGTVNTAAEGNYTVSYSVSDAAGNLARKDRIIQVAKKIVGKDTDGDGKADIQDLDDDNDGVLDKHDAFPLDPSERTDLEGDGIGDNADTDDDGNGIDDAQEQSWFIYKNKIAIVAGSRLEIQGLESKPSLGGDMFILTHTFSTDKSAYITANKTGEVHTGFKEGTADDSTLKAGTSFKAGTTSVIKMDADQVVIYTRAKFNKTDSFEIGGK